MRTLIAIAALTASGCVFDPFVSAVTTDADPTAPDANPFAADADPSAPDADPNAPDADPNAPDANLNAPDAMPPVPLIDTGLVVRYFMDEAASGTAPTDLIDSAPTPLSLPIDYGQASYVDVSGNRGLRWPSLAGNGIAQATFGSTKLYDLLRPAKTVTLEVVVDIDDAGAAGSDSQIAGMRGGNPDFMLTAVGESTIRFIRPFGTAVGGSWDGVNAKERMVLHLVFDSTAPAASRIELYKNGTLVPKTSGTPPDLDQTVGLGGADSIVIGNRQAQNRSSEGTIFYVAMYNVAMSSSDLMNNALRLLDNDDQ